MSDNQTYRVIIAGGGTGGHVYPAIAIANALKKTVSNINILFVGAKGKLEMEKVPAAGYEIKGLNISGFQRSLSWKNLTFPFKLLASLWKSFFIVRKFKPDLAIGVGGYASGPILYTCASKGVPSLIQEQNSYPGITNKILAKKANKICVAYEGLDRFFPSDKIVITGNPVREDIISLNREDKHKSSKTILVIGGSLGARTINESILSKIEKIATSDVNLIWQTGKLYFDEINILLKNAPKNVKIMPFIEDMKAAYRSADIIVSRAGALSISELCIVGKPVILVPSPNVSEDHQTKNAMALVSKNAALLISDCDSKERLVDTVIELSSNDKLCDELSRNILDMAKPSATNRIVEIARELLNNEN